MKYKIVFLDIDGTITHHANRSISISTKKAIEAMHNNGIRVVAATGRPLSMCHEIKALGIDTFITANGAYAKHQNEIIHKIPIDIMTAQEILEYSTAKNHGLSIFTENFVMNGVRNNQIMKALKETLSLDNYPLAINRINDLEVYLLCLYVSNEVVKEYELEFPHLKFERWHPFIVNILQEEVSKSLAIINILNYFGIDKSEAIAIGDGENDIDMIKLVGLGIAMGNGSKKLKKASDFVTKNSNEDGIEYALKKFKVI